jgi:glutathione synthase/RimK-type ligase-like ATP-grasp enzyme
MIVIVSSNFDEHARAVLAELSASSSEVFLLDMSSFPQQMILALAYNSEGEDINLRQNGREISLSECRAVWWRRPGSFAPDPAIKRPSHVEFIHNECAEAFAGLWNVLPASWMNPPQRDHAAARKVFQLKVAREVGLQIPQTLIANDVERARNFIEALGSERVIYKAFSATQAEWRETRLLGERELGLLDSVRYAPVIFQEYIEAAVDLRVTIVGEEIFAAAIHSQDSTYKVDFRMDMPNAMVEAEKLPDDIDKMLRKLMRRLGLVYGAIDMRRTADGRYVFLEINPAGQWLFIEERTKQPITSAVAGKLREMDSQGLRRAEQKANSL